jgi:hypothetical protein
MIADELRLYTKLRALEVPCTFDASRMTHDERCETLRAAVSLVPEVTFTIRDGKRITMGQEFARVFGAAP